MAPQSFVVFHMPNNAEFLAAFGRVAIRHAQLDHILRLTVKTFAGVTPDEARLATAGEGSSLLRGRIRKLAKAKLGDSTPALLRTYALLRRCKILTGKRNSLMHGICAKELNSEAVARDEAVSSAPMLLDENLGSRPLPSAQELDSLADEIARLTNEINSERRFGFIAEALLAAT